MDKISKLSQAIRYGLKFSKQGFSMFLNQDGSRCALQTAEHALAIAEDREERVRPLPDAYSDFCVRFNFRGDVIVCPICSDRFHVQMGVMHLNDTHKWSREAIADYLEERGY